MFEVRGDLLFRGEHQIKNISTKKKSRGRIAPKVLVIHYTASDNFGADVDTLTTSDRQASAHLVLGLDGTLVQIEDFRTKLWHAGRSEWRKRKSLNGWSIGIEVTRIGWLDKQSDDGRWKRKGTRWYDPEIEKVAIGAHPNGGRILAWPMFTDKQMDVLNHIVPVLRDHYGLEVVGHDMISPKRKQDPGLCIDRKMFDIWNLQHVTPSKPPHSRDPVLKMGDRNSDVQRLQRLLNQLNYPAGVEDGIFGGKTRRAVIRFQTVRNLDIDGVVGPQTWSALKGGVS